MYSAIVRLSQIARAPNIDPRRESTDLAPMVANITVNGLMQPPLLRCVKDEAGSSPQFEIVAGNRRVGAIAAIAAAGGSIMGEPVGSDPEIQAWCYDLGEIDDEQARAAALAENVCREDLHPVDEYEAFAKRVNAGATVEAIAAEYDVTTREVMARLALGQLHEDIRAKWRATEIDEETARAFTLLPDPARQKAALDDLGKRGQLTVSQIRILAGVDYSANAALRIVGEENYVKAGGVVVTDLFGDADALSDPDLARRLLAEMIETRCNELEADGWSFALSRASVKDHYTWPQIEPKLGYTAAEKTRKTEAGLVRLKYENAAPVSEIEIAELHAANEEVRAVTTAALLRAFKPAMRATLGCFVYVDGDHIKVDYGMQRPAVARKEAKAREPAQADAQAATPIISNAVAHDLSVMRTVIVSRAMAKNPRLCLEALVATLRTGDPNGPLRIAANGLPQLTPEAERSVDYLFPEQLAGAADMETEVLLGALSELLVRAIDLRRQSAAQPMDDDEGALCAAIDPAVWQRLERNVFSDPQGYFTRIPLPLLIDALKQMLGKDYEARGKKGDLVELAVAQARETHWVPEELRHPAKIAAQS